MSEISGVLGRAVLDSRNWRSIRNGYRVTLRTVLLVAVFISLSEMAMGQQPVASQDQAVSPTQDSVPTPGNVNVNPVARDGEIRARLQSVLEATGWFTEPEVRVKDGVVFFKGSVESSEIKEWASDLARKTQDVVAVANEMTVRDPPAWDFEPARVALSALWRDIVRSLPAFAFGLIILALSVGAGMLATRMARVFLAGRIQARLLRNVIAMALGGLVILLGTYIVLRVSGLTQLALTVVGGTGLIGLALGIAFRDITENFLASIILSMQRPFETGDLLEVAGVTGYVKQLNVRTTILMTLDGNLVQIPNATIYKSNLRNFTTTPNRREDFVVGIGYDDSISDAQELARKVMEDHPAVLDDPEPSVLVDNLGKATVNLRVYFWLNGREHSWLKVRSSVIRLVKLAFQERGISMPDEAREVVFPQGIPVTMLDGKAADRQETKPGNRPRAELPQEQLDAASTKAEGGLHSEAAVIEEQARHAQTSNSDENLLPGVSPS